MKAKLYLFGALMEMRLADENETVLKPVKGDTQETFTNRCQAIVENDYLEDFELVVIDKVTVESNDDAALLEAVETATGIQKDLITEVLKDRGLIKAKATTTRTKVEKQTVEQMKATEHYKECEANTGKFIEFSPSKSDEVHMGKIAGVALNKTNTIVYYTVVLADGKRKCCACKNETIKFVDAPVAEPKAEEKKAAETPKGKTTSKNQPKNQPGDASDDADDDLK